MNQSRMREETNILRNIKKREIIDMRRKKEEAATAAAIQQQQQQQQAAQRKKNNQHLINKYAISNYFRFPLAAPAPPPPPSIRGAPLPMTPAESAAATAAAEEKRGLQQHHHQQQHGLKTVASGLFGTRAILLVSRRGFFSQAFCPCLFFLLFPVVAEQSLFLFVFPCRPPPLPPP